LFSIPQIEFMIMNNPSRIFQFQGPVPLNCASYTNQQIVFLFSVIFMNKVKTLLAQKKKSYSGEK